MKVCAGTQLLQSSTAHPILLLPPADVHGPFSFHKERPSLGKMKIKKKSCSHKLKLLEGKQLGWHCKAQPSWVTTCHTVLKTNVHWHESHLGNNGKSLFRRPTLHLKSEGSWQREFTHKNFWTQYLQFPWFWIYNL